VQTLCVYVALCFFALHAPAHAAPSKHPVVAKTSASKTASSTGKVTSKDLRGGNFKQSRETALQKNHGVCEYCQKKPATQGDHVIPVKKYAEKVNSGRISRAGATKKANSEQNVIGACGGRGGCNQQKGGKLPSVTPSKGKWVPPNPTPNAKQKIGSIPKSYR
jgi:5-methylcytosine-specific restriction endonuclease McrA